MLTFTFHRTEWKKIPKPIASVWQSEIQSTQSVMGISLENADMEWSLRNSICSSAIIDFHLISDSISQFMSLFVMFGGRRNSEKPLNAFHLALFFFLE